MVAPLGTRPGSEQFSYHAHPDGWCRCRIIPRQVPRIVGHHPSGTCLCTPLDGLFSTSGSASLGYLSGRAPGAEPESLPAHLQRPSLRRLAAYARGRFGSRNPQAARCVTRVMIVIGSCVRAITSCSDMLRFRFIDAAIVARFKRRDARRLFTRRPTPCKSAARRGAQHRMTEAAILRPKVVGCMRLPNEGRTLSIVVEKASALVRVTALSILAQKFSLQSIRLKLAGVESAPITSWHHASSNGSGSA